MHLTRPAGKRTGQRAESPVASCSYVTVSCLSCLFWHLNVSEMQSLNSRSGWECGRITSSLKNWMLCILRLSVWTCLAWGTLRYLQDQKAKIIPSPVSWTAARSSTESCCFTMVMMTDIGIAFWCFLAGLAFLNDLSSRCRRNPGFPLSSKDGLGLPCSRKV
jgi:hypothetical protein